MRIATAFVLLTTFMLPGFEALAAADTGTAHYPRASVITVPETILSAEQMSDDTRAVAMGLRELGSSQAKQLNRYIQDMAVNRPEAYSRQDKDAALDDLLKLTAGLRQLEGLLGSLPDDVLQTQSASWSLITPDDVNSTMESALMDLAVRAAQSPGCELARLQISDIPRIFWFEFAMRKIATEQSTCQVLPLSELHLLDAPRLARLRPYIGNESFSFVHSEILMSRRTCDDQTRTSLEPALGLCAWLRQKIDFGRKVPPTTKSKFAHFPSTTRESIYSTKASVESMIAGLPSDGRIPAARRALSSRGIEYWISRDLGKIVFPLTIYRQNATPGLAHLGLNQYSSEEFLVVVTNGSHVYLALPDIQWGQYDNGGVSAITDTDSDGNIEVWFFGVWGECDGEDLVPGKDCSINYYYRLEQFGGNLAPFVLGSQPREVDKSRQISIP